MNLIFVIKTGRTNFGRPSTGGWAQGSSVGHRLVSSQRQRHRLRLGGLRGEGLADPRRWDQSHAHRASRRPTVAPAPSRSSAMAPDRTQRPPNRGLGQPRDHLERRHRRALRQDRLPS